MNATSAAQKATVKPSTTRQAKEKPAAAKPVPAKAKPAAPVKAVAAVPAAKPAAKVAVTTAAKPAAKPAAKAAVKTVEKPANKSAAVKTKVVANGSGTVVAKPAAAVPAEKEKPKKIKLVRDSFTMPEAEYAVLGQVKKSCLKAGVEVKKSELLRIGVALIRDLDMASLKRVLATLPQLKSGRPVKEK